MNAFTVQLKNQPGELARLCEAVAERQVNAMLAGVTSGDVGLVSFVADREDAARAAMDAAGVEFTERPAIGVRLDNRPGMGAAMARTLAAAGINLELFLPTMVTETEAVVAICADDLDAARRALSDHVVSG